MPNNHLHPLFRDVLNAAALRPTVEPRDEQRDKRSDEPNAESVASAFEAQTLLRAAVNWHQAHEGEVLPTPLLLILCAARRVC